MADEDFPLGLDLLLQLVTAKPLEAVESFRRIQPFLSRVHQALVNVHLNVILVILIRLLKARRASTVAGGNLLLWSFFLSYLCVEDKRARQKKGAWRGEKKEKKQSVGDKERCTERKDLWGTTLDAKIRSGEW